MAKYEALGEWLLGRGAEVRVFFAQLDRIVNGLPPSARRYPAWWRGPAAISPTHVQKRAWESVGYRVGELDLEREVVVFRRI